MFTIDSLCCSPHPDAQGLGKACVYTCVKSRGRWEKWLCQEHSSFNHFNPGKSGEMITLDVMLALLSRKTCCVSPTPIRDLRQQLYEELNSFRLSLNLLLPHLSNTIHTVTDKCVPSSSIPGKLTIWTYPLFFEGNQSFGSWNTDFKLVIKKQRLRKNFWPFAISRLRNSEGKAYSRKEILQCSP